MLPIASKSKKQKQSRLRQQILKQLNQKKERFKESVMNLAFYNILF
jgi:hypothetical protein